MAVQKQSPKAIAKKAVRRAKKLLAHGMPHRWMLKWTMSGGTARSRSTPSIACVDNAKRPGFGTYPGATDDTRRNRSVVQGNAGARKSASGWKNSSTLLK